MILLALVACKHPDPAPADIDGLAHYFWQKYDEGADEEIASAAVNLDAAVAAYSATTLGADDAYLSEHMVGTITDLSKAEAELVLPGDDRDPADARGMLAINPLDCTLDQVERLSSSLDQPAIYPNAYDAYDREYTSDHDAYVAREVPFLTWHVELDATTAGYSYHESLDGGLRYQESLDEVQSPWGPVLMHRTWMVTPAEFAQDNGSFPQDYQLEVLYEREPGTTVHFYVIWRQAAYVGLDQDDDALMNLQVSGLFDWDDDFQAACAADAAG